MRFKRHIELEHGLKQIEIAPLIDTVFLLLIFFLLTSNFVIQPGMKVKLPKAVTSEILQPQSTEILVSADNTVYFEGKAIGIEDLKKIINQSAKNKQAVLIKADRRASLGETVKIWDMCRDSGVALINIATD